MRTESELRDVLARLNAADEAWAAAQRNRTATTVAALSALQDIHRARTVIAWVLGDRMLPSFERLLSGPTAGETDE
jgi:hypothetical protein